MTTQNQNLQPATKTTTVWDVDAAHSSATFSVRHMMIATVRGSFAVKSATVTETPTGVTVEAELDAASVNTGAADRDNHLRSADFFDVATHPTIRFVATRVEEDQVEGELTIRGVTRPVTLEVERGGQGKDPWGKTRTGLYAKTTIDRKEFGLNWNAALEAGGVLVGDKVKVELDLQFVKRE